MVIHVKNLGGLSSWSWLSGPSCGGLASITPCAHEDEPAYIKIIFRGLLISILNSNLTLNWNEHVNKELLGVFQFITSLSARMSQYYMLNSLIEIISLLRIFHVEAAFYCTLGAVKCRMNYEIVSTRLVVVHLKMELGVCCWARKWTETVLSGVLGRFYRARCKLVR